MYEQFFGFSEKPFNITPDPRFLYLSSGHQEALASMIYGIKERRGFVSIIGEIGTGKTTLLNTLFNELGKEVTTVFIFNTKVNFKQLLQNILLELNLTPVSNNKVLLINQLNDFLIEKLSINENIALIIDEAQNLSTTVLEELRMLSNLETTREKLLQIVLVGQPELDAKLRSPDLRQLKQRISINCYLTPLNRKDQMSYISHRLTIAHATDHTIFSPESLELIFKHSKGIPRIINILCDNALLSAYSKKQSKVSADVLKEVISDYERTEAPFHKQEAVSLPSEKPKRRFARTALIIILLFFLIFIPLLLGITAYTVGPTTVLHFITTLMTNPTTQPIQDHKIANDNSTITTTPLQSNAPALEKNTKQSIPSTTVDIQASPLASDSILTGTISLIEETDLPSNSEPIQGSTPSKNQTDRVVVAKKGDIVSTLALKEYGTINDTIFDIIKRANPEIPDLDLIEIGQPVRLPALTVENSVIEINNNTFTIHIGTFSSYDSARIVHNKLLKKNYSIMITPVSVTGNQQWYRVTVGDFTDPAEALQFAHNISVTGFPYSF